jgi:methionine-rich copper-binding protein CopC
VKTPILSLCLVLAAWPAFAHAFLQHANPGAGAQLKEAPKQLALTFSERLEPAFSGVSVTDADGHEVEARPPAFSEANVTVTLKPLAPGTYRVSWHAVSVDTHRTDGSYKFKVGQ